MGPLSWGWLVGGLVGYLLGGFVAMVALVGGGAAWWTLTTFVVVGIAAAAAGARLWARRPAAP